MMAKRLGLPASHFVAATNVNRVVPNFMESGVYTPMDSIATISNAMDVGDPSNFVRIREIYDNDFEKLRADLSSYSFTDEQTKEAMSMIYDNSGYVTDPHGAVGYLGLKKHLSRPSEHSGKSGEPSRPGIFLETAHPVKFLEVVEPVLGVKIDYPEQIQSVIDREKKAEYITSYGELKQFLLS
jgi:threonine synthase